MWTEIIGQPLHDAELVIIPPEPGTSPR